MKSYHLRSVRVLREGGESELKCDSNVKLVTELNGSVAISPEVGSSQSSGSGDGQSTFSARISSSITRVDLMKSGPRGLVVSVTDKPEKDSLEVDSEAEDDASYFLEFDSSGDRNLCVSDLLNLKQTISRARSVFTDRTDDASATQYFQFYGYLSQQQNMMQDYIRTATYQRAVLDNLDDFRDKVVLDVGAGSGILSFFACQAGAKKVYAVEASSMAAYADILVKNNNLSDTMQVLAGKIEEITLPEQVDLIISEPMGYMLLNERMLETFLHAKKWLKPGGKMYPSRGDLHVAPFTDDTLYMEQFNKANFWYTSSFHGVNLTSLREAAVKEYFSQPVVDTFDIRICLANSVKYTIDFQTSKEDDLHNIDIPLNFPLLKSGTIHGLAFWFDVAFLGSQQVVWLSTAPTEPLTHWYQVRCLLENPIFVRVGQVLTGRVLLKANTRQSYDVTIDVGVEGTSTRSSNTLDLKNPYFRYTGQAPQPPPGNNTNSPSEKLWTANVHGTHAGNDPAVVGGVLTHSSTGGVPSVGLFGDYVANGLNGSLGGGVAEDMVIDMGASGMSPQMQQNSHRAQQRRPSASSSSGSGVAGMYSMGSPSSAAVVAQSQVILGGNSNFPVNNALMIGDYAVGGGNAVMFPSAGVVPIVTAPSPFGFRK